MVDQLDPQPTLLSITQGWTVVLVFLRGESPIEVYGYILVHPQIKGVQKKHRTCQKTFRTILNILIMKKTSTMGTNGLYHASIVKVSEHGPNRVHWQSPGTRLAMGATSYREARIFSIVRGDETSKGNGVSNGFWLGCSPYFSGLKMIEARKWEIETTRHWDFRARMGIYTLW